MKDLAVALAVAFLSPAENLLQPSLPAASTTNTIPLMHDRSYVAYIMASRSHTLYTGMSGDLHKHVWQHKWKESPGSFTARYNCDRLVWFESFQDVAMADIREKQLKGWTRAKKIALIEKTNPAWVDLSKEWYDLEPADYKRALDHMNT